MKRGTISDLGVSLSMAALLGACTTQGKQVEVRAVGAEANSIRNRSPALDEARGLLALNNVGLALEAFRKVHRDNPSAEALAGIADCYLAMGRNDLAKTNYEAALAMAPDNINYLRSVAAVMDRMGLKAQAMLARAQANAQERESIALAKAAPHPAEPAQVTEVARANVVPIAPTTASTVVVPKNVPARTSSPPVDTVASHVSEAPPPKAPPARIDLAEASTVTLPSTSMPTLDPLRVETEALPAPSPAAETIKPAVREAAIAEARRLVDERQLSSTVTVKLPAARPYRAPPAPARTASEDSGPRLERLSRGEVALVTTAKPLWAAQVVQQTRLSTTVRWVPVKMASAQANVLVLNAARVSGYAAAARHVLTDRGWRRIEIGDHAEVRQRSVVLYPADRRRLARSLAAQFGIEAREVEGKTLTVLLGIDLRDRIRG